MGLKRTWVGTVGYIIWLNTVLSAGRFQKEACNV
jgi:hypothetical protein